MSREGTATRLESFCLFLTVALFLWGCTPRPPLQELAPGDLPEFIDDGDRAALLHATRQHLLYLETLPEEYGVEVDGRVVTRLALKSSLAQFLDIVANTPEPFQMHSRISANFQVFQAGGKNDAPPGEMLVTGYYEPLFEGSLEPVAPYIHPLYAKPADLVVKEKTATGGSVVGRRDAQGTFQPYWTRGEIENSRLLAGHELLYLKDPFDAFLLHVQGSGRVRLPDGRVRPVRFAGHNGHTYVSIGKFLVDQGRMSLQEVSVPAIRRYLENHPEQKTTILQHNPRFIFFTWGDDTSPKGSMGVPLTPGRSIAIDPRTLPPGMIGYLQAEKALVDIDGKILRWAPLSRFVLPQDSGAAIKGPGRVDLFLGSGDYAEISAGQMKQKGRLYFLLAKKLINQ